MKNRTARAIALGALIAPLVLGLAACKDGTAKAGGDPVAKVAPPAGKVWSDVVSRTAEGGFVMGNPNAPIKLIEYGSLTCPHCAEFAKESDDELQNTFVDSGRVSFEFRSFLLNGLDLALTMMVQCGPPESFFALKKQTYEGQHDIVTKWTDAGEAKAQAAVSLPPAKRYAAMADLAGLPAFYSARGISQDQAKTCLADTKLAQTLVDNTNNQGRQFDIQGTPTFLLNGRKLDENTWPAVKADLEKAGAR